LIDTASSLTRKVRRLEAQLEGCRAERDLYHMMTFDLASDRLIATIQKKYPAIADKWGEKA
jgi:hypothetical protein